MFKEKLLKDALRIYAGEHVLRRVLRLGAEALELNHGRRIMTVMSISPQTSDEYYRDLSPIQSRDGLREFHAQVINVIERNAGIVDGFIGDEVIAYFGREDDFDHAAAAIASAAELSSIVVLPQKSNLNASMYPFIGVDTGFVFIGNFGTTTRMKFTVMGDVVNMSSRLLNRCRTFRVKVLITNSTVRAARQTPVLSLLEIGEIEVSGTKVKVSTLEGQLPDTSLVVF